MRWNFGARVRLWIVLFFFLCSAAGSRGAEPIRHYLLQLRDEPVVTHLRRRGRPMRLLASEAASYRGQLLARHAILKRQIEALPSGQVRAEMDTVFNGMAVSLRPEDVAAVRGNPDVESVIPSLRYHKALDAAGPLIQAPQAWSSPNVGGEANAGAAVRIAVIDTGMDINHPMLQDPALTAPPGFPRFTSPTSSCPNSDQRFTNSKVIVARNYVSLLENPDPNCNAEDRDGHGTFVAGIAAGKRVTAPLASLAGVAPKAFLGSYKVFGTPGVNEDASLEAILKAIDDAVKDGMQIINLSLGAETDSLPADDPLAVAVGAATAAGVTVVVAAGNEGPATGTITSPGISPAAITVGATTHARFFANPLTISAPVPVPPELATLGALPGNGPAIAAAVGPAPLEDVQRLDGSGTACSPLPAGSLAGQFAFIRRGQCNFSSKISHAFIAGAIAAILYNNQLDQPPVLMDVENSTQIPAAMLGNREGLTLKQFLASAGAVVEASLGAERRAISTTPNRTTQFSSAGPSTDLGIKPDLVAPGTNLYSAAQRNDPTGEQYDASGFDIASGTSFSAPLVAGAAALVKQAFPNFTPAQIKSAVVQTTAKVVSSPSGGHASVLAQGNGLLDAAAAVSTPATVSPTSISFGARTPGSVLSSTTSLTVTNVGPATDSFTVSVTQTPGSDPVVINVSPATVSLGSGVSRTLSVNATSSLPLNGNVSGYLAVFSQNTQKSLTIPYWGTFMHPRVNSGGVLNAASYTQGTTALAPGSLISIFGSQLANETAEPVTLPLPKSLGGVQVRIDDTPIPLRFVSPAQINAQVPLELSSGTTATLEVRLNGVASDPTTFAVVPSAPGIFTADQSGRGAGAVFHASDFSFVTAANPARAGEFLSVLATGLGSVSPSVDSGAPASSTVLSVTRITPTANLGGVPAAVRFSGLAPSFVGVYQVNIQVPENAPSGEQTLILNGNGVASNPVTVSIAK